MTHSPRQFHVIGCALLLLALTLGFGAVRPTSAAWTDTEVATASVSAATLEAIENLTCSDHTTPLGLLRSELFLNWNRPLGLPADAQVEYHVSWRVGLVGNWGNTVTTSTNHTYNADFSVLGVSVEFRIQPRVGNWVGPTMRYRAANVAVLGIPVRVECDTILGIL